MDLSLPPARIDSAELQKIKNELGLRERINSEEYEDRNFSRSNPQVLFSDRTEDVSLSEATLRGLKYPLELDGNGGLMLSSNVDRVRQQILEILDTRIGERVYRQFFGIPEVLFETIDESSLSQTIKAKLLELIPILLEIEVESELREDGTMILIIVFSVEGSERTLVNYAFSI